MSIVIVLPIIVNTGFLLRFLTARTKEQKKTLEILRAHWLDHFALAKDNPRRSKGVSLRIGPPQEFHILSMSQVKMTQPRDLS